MASSLSAGVANISYGSAIESGGAQFFGADSAAVDSISIGYFTGDVVDATNLVGWNSFDTYSSFSIGGWANPNTVANADTTAGDGLTAYLLITDGALQAVLRVDDWVALSGVDAGTTPDTLTYRIAAADTALDITSFEAVGTQLDIISGQGTNFAGGFSGTGISINLSAVPEPSAFAALAGFLALGCVALRRRK